MTGSQWIRKKAWKAGWTMMLCSAGLLGAAGAQAIPTAAASLRVTGFAGFSGNFTGLELGKNLGITAGADVETRPFFTFYPALEVRGTYPFSGTLDRQRNVLGGLRLARTGYGFRSYGDVLFGRGEIVYGPGGYPGASGNVLYTQSVSNVLSLGGGVEYGLSPRLGVKGDFQLQRYMAPVTPTGDVYSKIFTVGAVYRFGFSGSVRGGQHY